jgi:hypothetical protein
MMHSVLKNKPAFIWHCLELVLAWVTVNLASVTEMIAALFQGHVLTQELPVIMVMKFRWFSVCFLSSEQMATQCSFWSLLSSPHTDFTAVCHVEPTHQNLLSCTA